MIARVYVVCERAEAFHARRSPVSARNSGVAGRAKKLEIPNQIGLNKRGGSAIKRGKRPANSLTDCMWVRFS